MNKKFLKYDKKSTRKIIVNIDEFNAFLQELDAKVEFVKRSKDLQEAYDEFIKLVDAGFDQEYVGLSIYEYDEKFYGANVSLINYSENTPPEILLSNALGVRVLRYGWVKDSAGLYLDDLLELTYKLK